VHSPDGRWVAFMRALPLGKSVEKQPQLVNQIFIVSTAVAD